MPRFDGTGPQGQGPMTGRGEGYCAIPLGRVAQGYTGLQGRPLLQRRWFRLFGRAGSGRGRGRGKRSARW